MKVYLKNLEGEMENKRRSVVVSSSLEKSFEYSSEENVLSFLDKVSIPKSAHNMGVAEYVLSFKSFYFFSVIVLFIFAVMVGVYVVYIRPRPNSNKIKLYN
jgi:hypothetical protein